MRRHCRWWLPWLALVLGCGGEDALCGSDDLREALAGATAGDVLELEACTFEGNFAVPEGVRLRGQSGTVIRGSGDVLTLAAGASAEGLEVLTTDGRALVLEAGEHELQRLGVRTERGTAIFATGAEGRWSDLEVTGNLDIDRPFSIAPMATVEEGLYPVILQDSTIEMQRVNVLRGGPWGVIVLRGTLNWREGVLADVVGTGVYADDSEVRLENVELRNLRQGLQPGSPVAVLLHESMGTMNGVRVLGSEGLGVLSDSSEVAFANGEAMDCAFGGLWAQGGRAEVSGSLFDGNGFGGIVGRNMERLDVRSTMIRGTEEQLALSGDMGVRVGDGLHATEVASLALDALDLVDNTRVGLLLDGDVGIAALESVTVSGGRLGAIHQNDGTILRDGWDVNVARTSVLTTNDAAQDSPLFVAPALPSLPEPDVSL